VTPARGKLLVRAVDTPDHLPGGHVILPPETRKSLTAQQAEVIAVGEPAWCEGLDICARSAEVHGSVGDVYGPGHAAATHPTELQTGDWVLLRSRCLQETDQVGVWCCQQDDVVAVLRMEGSELEAIDRGSVGASE